MKTSGTDTPRFTPSEEWIDAFAAQCTDEMRNYAKRYAARRLRGIGKAGGYVDDYAARELVQDAIGDTLAGVVAWDPTVKALQQHIEDTIQFRTRHERNRVKRFRHERIDAFHGSSEDRIEAQAEVEGALAAERDDASMESSLYASQVLAQLRALAANDPPVLKYLDAIESGARSRDDILHSAGMTMKTYRNVRGRLRRLAEQLDQDIIATLRRA